MDDVPVAEYFELIVWLPGRGPMHKLFKALTLQHAIKIAETTYGGCSVEAAPTVAKPQLVRSTTSPAVLQRLRYKRVQKLINKSKMSETVEQIRKAAVARVLTDQKRQDDLDELYKKAGRDDKSHPMYSLYTGLYAESRS